MAHGLRGHTTHTRGTRHSSLQCCVLVYRRLPYVSTVAKRVVMSLDIFFAIQLNDPFIYARPSPGERAPRTAAQPERERHPPAARVSLRGSRGSRSKRTAPASAPSASVSRVSLSITLSVLLVYGLYGNIYTILSYTTMVHSCQTLSDPSQNCRRPNAAAAGGVHGARRRTAIGGRLGSRCARKGKSGGAPGRSGNGAGSGGCKARARPAQLEPRPVANTVPGAGAGLGGGSQVWVGFACGRSCVGDWSAGEPRQRNS